jgi:hypothetical protein
MGIFTSQRKAGIIRVLEIEKDLERSLFVDSVRAEVLVYRSSAKEIGPEDSFASL